jgi:uncharacterized membrane protein YvlD (DUF360 family)
MRPLLRGAFRFGVVTLIEALSVLLMATIVPGIALQPPEPAPVFAAAIFVAIVLAIINSVVRPVLILLTLPLNVLTFGFSTLLINGAMLLLASYFLPYFVVTGVLAALIGSLILAVVNTILTSLTTIDDDYAFFDGVAQWLSRRRLVMRSGEQGRGLVLLEIDGLSYQRAQRAIEEGLMPTLRDLLVQGGHRLSRFDCGLPSQTSACQAGIMYGDNYDIPAFRWYEKERGRLLVSNNFADAAEINSRFAHGHGLLRGGASINNLMSGDAQKTLLTMSALSEGPAGERRSPEDLYLVFLNPYFFARLVILTLWDVLVELAQALRQRLRNEQPRVNRLQNMYPILRALSNVFLRDLGAYMVIMEVIRGSPAIYTTFFGYDEIAHHAGPDSRDALHSLKGIDTQIRRIQDVIRRKAPRPYDLFVLSDHGQAFGAPFRQRYGHTLKEFIAGLAHGTAVAEINASEDVQSHTAALLAEIQTMEERLALGRVREAAIGRARQALQNRLARDAPPPLAAAGRDEEVIVGVSGNLANVYFELHVGKVNMLTLNAVYPGLLDGLVGHPGVGLVVAHDHAGAPWALGKAGARNLDTGAVKGSADPLRPYGDVELRAAQLRRLAGFPHAGDLIIISTLYADGAVAAFEEHVGSHGGLGGQQTDAFLLHPADMPAPSTSNAAELFPLLNARRDRTEFELNPKGFPKPLGSAQPKEQA